MVCPLGLAEQFSISEMGERLPKRRLTHDQTFTALPDSKSVNNLTDSSKFAELVYGFCLHRIIYQIMSLRTSFPEDRIMLMKFDFAKAYRRIQYNGISALRCMTISTTSHSSNFGFHSVAWAAQRHGVPSVKSSQTSPTSFFLTPPGTLLHVNLPTNISCQHPNISLTASH
jgi:hypothetical protein